MAPDEDYLRKILVVGRGGDGEHSYPEESPLLLFPSPGAEFLEVSVRVCAYLFSAGFVEGRPPEGGAGGGVVFAFFVVVVAVSCLALGCTVVYGRRLHHGLQ